MLAIALWGIIAYLLHGPVVDAVYYVPGAAAFNYKDGDTIDIRVLRRIRVTVGLADNLPCVTKYRLPGNNRVMFEQGYRLGYVGNDKQIYLNNHLKIILSYKTENDADGQAIYRRVVGFEVTARSINWGPRETNKPGNCDVHDNTKSLSPLAIPSNGTVDVLFTHEVTWHASNTSWSDRWDVYLELTDTPMHLFAIANSLVIVFFLSGILLMIIIRTLRKDIAKYNKVATEDDSDFEESGWKLVHGDVFRPPKHPMFLVALIGSGIQIFCATFMIIVFAMFGLLSPAYPGSLTTAIVLLFEFMGLIAGYFSARLYRTFGGEHWKRTALMTGLFYLTVVCSTCFILNIFFIGNSSSNATPIGVILLLLFLWLGVSLPLVFIGFYFGYRKEPYAHPCHVTQIARQIPDQKWFMNPFIATPLAGLLPFGAMYVELYFIFNAIWENQFYYVFGFLFLLFIVIVISCAEISIVMTYFQLCGEDYHWWWRSFILSGGPGIYVFLYGILFFVTKLEITEFVPTLWYFGYTFLMAFTLWLLTGVTGFYAAYGFTVKIYSSIKVD